jgi:hypothetical protein
MEKAQPIKVDFQQYGFKLDCGIDFRCRLHQLRNQGILLLLIDPGPRYSLKGDLLAGRLFHFCRQFQSTYSSND